MTIPVTDEATAASLAAGDVIEKVRREVAAVNAPESWKARAEAAEAKLAAIRRLCQAPAAAVGTAMGGKHIPGDRVAAEVLAIIGTEEGGGNGAMQFTV